MPNLKFGGSDKQLSETYLTNTLLGRICFPLFFVKPGVITAAGFFVGLWWAGRAPPGGSAVNGTGASGC